MGRTYRDVTASAPCPACGHKDWCAWDGDLLRCQRPAESSSPEGLRRIDQGPDHVLYAPERAPAVSRRGPRKRNDPPPATLAALAVRCRGQLDHERLELLATGLGVCASSLQRVGIGWALRADLEPLGAQWEGKRPNWAWTFPEFDGQGRLCGLCLRADDGRKSSPASSRTGARRGLSMPVDEQLRPVLSDGPVLVVEGASDVAAACCLGLTAVGRPSNSGGTDELAVLLKDREVLVVGENDAKQSGEWPGKEGALRVAVGLSGQWGKPAHWVLPPAGVKDLRELLRRRVAEGLLLDDEAACRAAGADLLNGLQSACQAASKEGRRVVIKPMNSYESRPVGWLWRDHIPLGKTTLIGGDPNLGKSFLTLDFAARVSAGRTWPDGSPCPAGDVLILSAEDDPADTIRPRLEAADANLDRISILHTVEDRGGTSYFDLTRDLEALQEGIERLENPRLVIIDPIGAYLGQTNENRNSEVRTVLAAMGEMAARSGVAVVMVMHLNKASDMKAMYRYSGSIAFVAAPRAAWMVAKDKNDPGRRLFVPSKLNIVKDPRGWAYRIMEGDAGPRVEWLDDEVRETADDLLGGGDGGVRRATRRVEAAEWLQEYLTDGPVPASEVKDAGRAVGFTDVTLERAKRELGVESCKVGMDGGWCWQLAEQGHESRDGRCHEDDHFHPPSGDHLRRKGPPRGFFDDGAPASGDHLRLESAPEGPKPG